MALLTCFVAAEEDEIEAVGESLQPGDEWSGLTLRDVTVGRVVALHCVLTGDLLDDAYPRYEPVYVSPAEGALVLRMADSAMVRLVELDEEVQDAVAMELAATEEFEYAGWDQGAIADMLDALTDLARLAESQGQVLLVWMHPLRT